MAARGEGIVNTGETPVNERFFRNISYFQHEVTALQEQMARLADTGMIGGERADATDHCLAGIARLSSEVKDASSYLPTYDQRTYAEACRTSSPRDSADVRLIQAIKALQEKFKETRATFAPRSKFTFKTTRKNASAVSLNDAAELAAQKRLNLTSYGSPDASSQGTSLSTTPNHLRTPPEEDTYASSRSPLPSAAPPTESSNTSDPTSTSQGVSSRLLDPRSAAVRRPLQTTSTSVSISHQTSSHIILPSSATHASAPCSLTQITKCVVDLSVPSTDGAPFAAITVKGVQESLLVCGKVDGPAHVTDVHGSVLVVTCRQLRMHECKNVDVYLSCSSRPIIEDCSGIRFARLPGAYLAQGGQGSESQDMWDQVDDFKWLKAEHSPNWSILGPEDAVVDDAWREVVPGGPGWTLDDILKTTKVLR